jgi:hypothetical protein
VASEPHTFGDSDTGDESPSDPNNSDYYLRIVRLLQVLHLCLYSNNGRIRQRTSTHMERATARRHGALAHAPHKAGSHALRRGSINLIALVRLAEVSGSGVSEVAAGVVQTNGQRQ